VRGSIVFAGKFRSVGYETILEKIGLNSRFDQAGVLTAEREY